MADSEQTEGATFLSDARYKKIVVQKGRRYDDSLAWKEQLWFRKQLSYIPLEDELVYQIFLGYVSVLF